MTGTMGAQQQVWSAAGVTLFRLGKDAAQHFGETCSGERSRASVKRYRLTDGSGAWSMDIGYLQWASKEVDVRVLACGDGVPKVLLRLESGLRLSVLPAKGPRVSGRELVVDLRQARLKPDADPPWSNLFKASAEELRRGAGLSVLGELERLGATVGTREDVLGDTGRNRSYLCAVFPGDTELPAVVAFVLTRVVPLRDGYTAGE